MGGLVWRRSAPLAGDYPVEARRYIHLNITTQDYTPSTPKTKTPPEGGALRSQTRSGSQVISGSSRVSSANSGPRGDMSLIPLTASMRSFLSTKG